MRKGRDGGETGKKEENTDGHYVIASSWPPEFRPLERRTVRQKWVFKLTSQSEDNHQTEYPDAILIILLIISIISVTSLMI